jgi:AraC family transcriptional regulator of adaptative response/methylated-DNA-[protein]-cysteine methyltransferase
MKSTPLEDEARWQAVLSRDTNADNQFVYGVHSTRIYCRPSCPSRRPQIAGVSFFENGEAAQNAGYRACLRCQPDAENSEYSARLQRACELLNKAATRGETLSLEALSEELKISPSYLQRTFKQATGLSPREYSAAARLQHFKDEMKNGDNVTNAMLDAGYNSSRALQQDAARGLGMTPATYGRGGKGAQIQFDIAPCELGFLLAAQTSRGLCAVRLGDSETELETKLREEFFAAQIARDAGALSGVLALLKAHLINGKTQLNLPLDVRATAFQMRVWSELQKIKSGETRTYTEVANALGQPTAVRAVASACAANSVALVIPCHRVIRQGGKLAGYRWSLERKRKLLENEKLLNND